MPHGKENGHIDSGEKVPQEGNLQGANAGIAKRPGVQADHAPETGGSDDAQGILQSAGAAPTVLRYHDCTPPTDSCPAKEYFRRRKNFGKSG